MKYSNQELAWASIKTIFFLVFCDILLSTFFPSIGIYSGRFSVNVLIVMFISFFINSSFVPYLILIIQWFHSLFTVETWPVGGLAGIILACVIYFLRDVFQLKSRLSIIPVAIAGHVIWYALVGGIIAIKLDRFEFLSQFLIEGLVGGLVLGLISPLIYILLDYIWKIKRSAMGIS
jgi:hypothetical protein